MSLSTKTLVSYRLGPLSSVSVFRHIFLQKSPLSALTTEITVVHEFSQAITGIHSKMARGCSVLLAVYFEYEGAYAKCMYRQWLSHNWGWKEQITTNMPPSAKVLAVLDLPVELHLTQITMLEAWKWPHGAVPEWFCSKKCRAILNATLDNASRQWTFPRLADDGPSLNSTAPVLIGGGNELGVETFDAKLCHHGRDDKRISRNHDRQHRRGHDQAHAQR
ncbi:hypothetical protein Micbo1qcDRAFT_170241 [Microdochium bolleyi]|uniref:Uncharacterized protein n=1 Tax=Microdochium bolleyi TaxID=196109 RepID=A0A136JGY5_9PEZI|nr:hypothetical protein Micbo1qcDRAFT_170241 [Microdochium bolleyi]